jgi:hypothetical protein
VLGWLGGSRNGARLELGGDDILGGRHDNGGRLGTAHARGRDLQIGRSPGGDDDMTT